MQVTQILLLNTPETVYATASEQYKPTMRVVVSTPSGLDIGVIKSNINTKEDVELVTIVREFNEQDKITNCENCRYTRSLLPEIKKEAEKHKLDMKIGFISTNLDRSKIVVNYTAEDRVDFRDLIKVLGTKYKTRIEMKQIGNRDETKVIGALGVCGRVTCCKAFLSEFEKVSIKMAKNQNISLNPTRINGMCGRLLCCLKYEDEFYEEMQKKMPKIGHTITTPDGKGVVSALDFLKEKVTLTFTKDDTTETKIYDLNELQSFKDKTEKK